MLDLLERAGKLTGAARARSLVGSSGFLAHHVGVQRAWTFFRKMKFPGILWPLVHHDIDHLRNHVAGTLDDDGVPDPDIAAVGQLLAVAPYALDVVFVVQRDILHDDAADADRLQL